MTRIAEDFLLANYLSHDLREGKNALIYRVHTRSLGIAETMAVNSVITGRFLAAGATPSLPDITDDPKKTCTTLEYGFLLKEAEWVRIVADDIESAFGFDSEHAERVGSAPAPADAKALTPRQP